MMPVIQHSVNNISPIPRAAFSLKSKSCITRCRVSRNGGKCTLSSERLILPLVTSFKLLPHHARSYSLYKRFEDHVLLATGTDVAVEESGPAASSEIPDEESEGQSDVLQASEGSPPDSDFSPSPQTKKTRPVRKSEMPPVKNEELIPGATFTGKVKSIQPFGAFVDFGAFTDGLVHVSRLSNSFVKDVGNFVSVGQEVKVTLIEANTESGRISLSMRENEDTSQLQQRKDGTTTTDRPRPNKKGSKFRQKKEDVKSSKFVKGQELEGTVKNLTRSGTFISLPEGEEGFLPQSEESDDGLATMMGNSSLQVGEEVKVRVLRINRGQVTLTMKKESNDNLDSKLTQGVVHAATNPFVLAFRENEDIAAFLDQREDTEKLIQEPLTVTASEVLEGKQNQAAGAEYSGNDGGNALSSGNMSSFSAEVADEIVSPEKEAGDEDLTDRTQDARLKEQVEAPVSTASFESKGEESIPDRNGSIISSGKEESEGNDGPVQQPSDQLKSSESNVIEVQENKTDGTEDKVHPEVTASDDYTSTIQQTTEVENNPKESEAITNSNRSTSEKNTAIETAASISPALVKQLREETGAGMMDCKRALSETEGDIVKAQEYLRKKGLASAEKKVSRATAEGRIGSYIHDGRIGVLLEVNCETDFVSRGEIFKELVDDLAMQVAACPQVQYLVTEDVPEEIVYKEKEIEMQKEDLSSKPEQIRSKIVEGRIRKRLEELALLEQPYIKNDKIVVKDLVKQTIATIGENIKVKRFVRFNLGEGLEKKSHDFAAEVAAQTAAKPTAVSEKDKPAEAEVQEIVQKPPTATISAALVKQLREETGAGMMDCKKALSEAEGDLEKAQEFLRKKGLSSADKKSSRLAAEGRIGSYIHDSRIGVLIEVNCETDFVGRSERFKELVDDLAMQVAACPQVQFVSFENIPKDIVEKEKMLEMQKEDLQSKPENIRERIVEGRVSKRLGELALLEQPFIKDDSLLVRDLVKQTVAALGENIKVGRFARFTLGESIEDSKPESEEE